MKHPFGAFWRFTWPLHCNHEVAQQAQRKRLGPTMFTSITLMLQPYTLVELQHPTEDSPYESGLLVLAQSLKILLLSIGSFMNTNRPSSLSIGCLISSSCPFFFTVTTSLHVLENNLKAVLQDVRLTALSRYKSVSQWRIRLEYTIALVLPVAVRIFHLFAYGLEPR